MRFKDWIYMEIGGNGMGIEPAKQMIPVSALPGIFNKADEPPSTGPTPTKGYLWVQRYYSKKKCKKK